MKKVIYVLVESILRAVSLYLGIFMFGTIFTMVLYKDTVLITFTLLAFVFCFIFRYIANRLNTPELLADKYSRPVLSAALIAISMAIAWNLFRLYWQYPVMYSGHEMEITTLYELKRNAYMLLRALPSYMHAQLAYVAGTSDATFDIDVYNAFSLWNYNFYGEMFIFGLTRTLMRAKNVRLFERRKVNETDRTS